MAYLTADRFRVLTLLPVEWLDAVEAGTPGFTAARIATIEALEIDSRLRKRYAVPFEDPVPLAIQSWVTRIMGWEVLVKHGVNAQSGEWDSFRTDAAEARAEIKEAANAETGLYDLPLRADTNASGISKGGPLGYSEASPFVWTDIQGNRGREEDRNGGGSQL